MNFPCLVLPYQWSPSRWKTFVSVLTQTIPLTGGCCAAAAGPAAVFAVCLADEAAGGAAGGGSEAAAGFPVAGAIEDPFAIELAADAVTSGPILPIVEALTPARERSAAEE